MDKTMEKSKKPIQIWWVMDENGKCVDFFDYVEYCAYIGRKIETYKNKGYNVATDVADKTTLFTFSKDGVSKTLRMTEVCD